MENLGLGVRIHIYKRLVQASMLKELSFSWFTIAFFYSDGFKLNLDSYLFVLNLFVSKYYVYDVICSYFLLCQLCGLVNTKMHFT